MPFRCDKDNDQFDGAKWFRFVGDAGTKLQTQPNPLLMQSKAYILAQQMVYREKPFSRYINLEFFCTCTSWVDSLLKLHQTLFALHVARKLTMLEFMSIKSLVRAAFITTTTTTIS